MTKSSVAPFSRKIFVIDDSLNNPLIIEQFNPLQDAIQLPADADSEVIPQFSFNDRYLLTEISGNTVISTRSGQILAVVKGITELKPFTGYTERGTYSLVSLDNEFFSTYIKPNFFEAWYVEFDQSDYKGSVEQAIQAGLVASAYEHYLRFGQFEAREDSLFAATADGNNTLYGSGYENGLVGVPISEGVYTRDIKPVTTGMGEVDTLIGAPGEDSFFLGNGVILNNAPQPFYVGEGDNDYALIKGFDQGSSLGILLSESPYAEYYPDVPAGTREVLTDRIVLAGKAYDYEFEKVGDDLNISYQGDLIAIIENAPPIDVPFPIPGATYLYTVGNVATFDQYSGFGTENTLYEPFYFEENPEVEAAIASGEYKSAFEHYVKVGQFKPEGEVLFSGTSGDDFLVGFGTSTLLSGMEVTFVDGKQEGYRTATNGAGEADYAVGGLGVDTFLIGNDNILDPEKGGEVWYLGNGDEDYLTIAGFDPYKDFLFGAGEFADYSFEVIDEIDDIFGRQVPYKSLEVSYKGDRVALLKYIDGSLTLPDLTSLQAFPFGDERPNGIALVAPQNQFLPAEPPAGSEFFNEAIYLAQTPSARAAVESGEYETALDYYIAEGQFKEDEEGIFHGTARNDIITGYGLRTDLYGVELNVEGQYVENPDSPFGISGRVTYIPQSLGVGEIDVLVGNDASIDEYFFGSELTIDIDAFNGTSTPLYVGQGDQDYAIAKNFEANKTGEIIVLSGKPKEYIYEADGSGFKVLTQTGDLVGIVAGVYNLRVASEFTTVGSDDPFNLFTLTGSQAGQAGFDEDLYLAFTPTAAQAVANRLFASGLDYHVQVGQFARNEEGEFVEAFFTGTNGNDIIIGFGNSAGLSGVGLTAVDAAQGSFTYDSLGEGEVDVLVGSEGENGFLLGTITNPAVSTATPFYVGKGNEDYALIQNFRGGEAGKDQLILAGSPDDYTYELDAGNTRILYRGDLVAIVEDVENLQVSGVFSEFGILTLNKFPVEGFNADVYLTFNPDIAAEIGEGRPFKTVLDYYVQKGQYREDGGGHGFFNGTDGNDVLQGFGFDKDLFGVGIASISGDLSSKITLTPTSTGKGQIDTLIGAQGIDGFYSAIFTEVNLNTFQGASTQLYVGHGDCDYVRIKDFDSTKDYFTVSGQFEDFTFKVEDGNFKAYKNGDLVAIIEDTVDLQPAFVDELSGIGLIELKGDRPEIGFNEDIYLLDNPGVARLVADGQFASALDYYVEVGQFSSTDVDNIRDRPVKGVFSGSAGNDYLIGFGANGYNLAGVALSVAPGAGANRPIQFDSLGTGEVDTLIGGEGVSNGFLLGSFPTSANATAQVFYVGKGSEDYAVIKNYETGESLSMAGKPEDYTFETTPQGISVSYKGDLVAKVEGVSSLQVSSIISSDVFVVTGNTVS